MAYSRTTWATGDIIEAAKLNNIEAGIVANEAAIAAVTGEAIARYGASGYNNSNPKLTRLYDAVGLNAAVGTDSATAVNDFDNLPPFNRKKCVGTWKAGTNKAVFEVAAYADDPDFAEDGSMGDYVAVDCPPAYYKESDDGNTRIVSAVPLAGFQPFKCLENPDAPGTCRQHTYLPAYALALKDGKAVSLPGFANRQGTYAELLANARTYANSEAAAYAMLEPADVNFYEETLYSIEFATHNCQSIMQGCAGLRNSNDDTCTMKDSTHFIVNNYYAARVVGEYVSIQPSNVDQNSSAYYPSHRIVSLTRCNADGTANASGSYTLVEVALIDSSKTYASGTTYRFVARPYITGACNGVRTPSGSPVSNTDSYHPMRYRYRENVFGNQFRTIMDFFDLLVGTGDDNYTLEWYKLKDPKTWATKNPSEADMQTDAFVKLSVTTAHANYIDGYVTKYLKDQRFPDVRVPFVGGNGSTSTFQCDYAYLVSSRVLRSVRWGGYWYPGANDGFGYAYANYAPSYGFAFYGGGLFFAQ